MDVKECIKLFDCWFNVFEDQYLVCTSQNMATVRQRIERGVDKRNDAYLILKVNIKDKSGQLPQNAWEWIRTQEERVFKDESRNNFIS